MKPIVCLLFMVTVQVACPEAEDPRLGESHLRVIPEVLPGIVEAADAPRRLEGETGADVRLVQGEMVVWSVRRGSPAAEAGVEPGWTVVRIGGEKVAAWVERGFAELPANSWRAGLLATAAKEKMEGRPGDRIEVTFRTGEAREKSVSLTLVEKPGVRMNIGHVRGVRVNVEWRWLGEVRMREATISIAVQPRRRVFEGMLAILVDELRMACAEAFAAPASAIERLPNGDAWQYVYADYVWRSGRRREGARVIPDVEVPLTKTVLRSGRDEVIEKALEWAR